MVVNWHLVVKNFTLLLTSLVAFSHCYSTSGMAISHCYWHLVVKNGNFTMVTDISLVKNGNFTFLLTSSGQEWQLVTPISSQLHYWHLVIKNGNFTLLLTSSDQEWQFHMVTHISSSRMAISHCYWHLVVKNGNLTLLLKSSGQEWQLLIATDI